MKKKTIIALIIVVTLLTTGCLSGSKPKDNDVDTGLVDPDDLVYIVDLCYVDKEYVETGDEEIPAILYYRNHHIFAPEGKQYLTLLDVTLRENVIGSESIITMITDKIQFNSVTVKDGTAFVDLVGEELWGSSLEEGLLISQIVLALRGSFEEIERVQFLIDGEIQLTLMGHYDTEEPYETGIHNPGRK